MRTKNEEMVPLKEESSQITVETDIIVMENDAVLANVPPLDVITSSQHNYSALVRSSDGKLHRITLENNLLNITLLNSKLQPTRHHLKIPLNFMMAIRSNRIKLSCGVPKEDVIAENFGENSENIENERARDAGNGNKQPPNVLYLYYAYRWNVYAWRLRECAFYFQSTTEKKHWAQLLGSTLAAQKHRPKRLLVFVNPFGGRRKANGIWSKEIEPFFKMANISYVMVKTEKADHALEMVRDLDPDRWRTIDGIVSVGGDGLFNEILSAAIIRTQLENNKDYNDTEVSLHTPRMRLGIIGAGSANSIVSSVHGVNDCPTAAIHIALGSECAVDVCAVYEDGKLSRFSADAISYGWLGDVLHDSERFRCLGPIRYQYSALRTSIRHPTYFGRVSFALSHSQPVLSTNVEETGSGPSNPTNIPPCTGPCEICSGNIPRDENFPFHWQTDFTHVICCVIPCVSPFTPYGLAPYTGLNDGTMDLALIPKVSRFTNMQIMRKVAMYGARFIRSEYPDIKVYRVSRWKFTPKALLIPAEEGVNGTNREDSGAWNLDGEILPQPSNLALHFRLHPGLIRYFGHSDELDLDDPEYVRCCVCCKCEKKVSQLITKVPNKS